MLIAPLVPPHSMVTQALFPPVLGGRGADLQALLRQFDRTQFWPPAQMRAAQFAQLSVLVAHAAVTTTFYRDRLAAAGVDATRVLTEEDWVRVPILTRREVQQRWLALIANPLPQNLQAVGESASSGSTREPVRVVKSDLDTLFWEAATLRDFEWNGIDATQDMVRITNASFLPDKAAEAGSGPEGLTLPSWGPPHSYMRMTGRLHYLHSKHAPAEHVAFLTRHRPAYLYTLPSLLRLMLLEIRERRLPVPPLRAVFCSAEVVDPTLRALCREMLGAPIVSTYTCAEAGVIALQCPSGDGGLHVNAESQFVEVLDDAGRPVKPGETGRVVITPLHNFVMPLLRYEIGDRATLGAPCACGRGLPHLMRIDGRISDYLTRPDGRRHYAPILDILDVRAVRQYQFIQHSVDVLELRLVVWQDPSAAELAELRRIVQFGFGDSFRLDIRIVDRIDPTPAGKFREFISHVAQGDDAVTPAVAIND